MPISFHNIVQSCHIKIHGTSKDIQKSLVKLSKYVNINSNKDDILKLAVYLNKYKNNKNNMNNIEFKFRNKSIILNEEQQEIVFECEDHQFVDLKSLDFQMLLKHRLGRRSGCNFP